MVIDKPQWMAVYGWDNVVSAKFTVLCFIASWKQKHNAEGNINVLQNKVFQYILCGLISPNKYCLFSSNIKIILFRIVVDKLCLALNVAERLFLLHGIQLK